MKSVRLCLLLAMIASTLLSPAARADESYTMYGGLPYGRTDAAAASDGRYIYVFGGSSYSDTNKLNQIYRFDPATGTAQTMAPTFPGGRGPAAVWDGRYIFVIGGHLTPRAIRRYDPANDTLTTLAVQLPVGRWFSPAVWTGQHIFMFAGWGNGYMRDIVRFDPATSTVTTMTARLPNPTYSASAVWIGSYAYIFGGTNGWMGHRNIYRYDPATDTLATMKALMPGLGSDGWIASSAATDGSFAYLFGGFIPASSGGGYGGSGSPNYTDGVWSYDPAVDRINTMSGKLPYARSNTAAVWHGDRAYIIGGEYTDPGECSGCYSYWLHHYYKDVIWYSPVPGPPKDVRAIPGLGLGQVQVTWIPPDSNTYTGKITNYQVYRETRDGGKQFLATTGAVQSYTDNSCRAADLCMYTVRAVMRWGAGDESWPPAVAAGWRL